MIDRETLLKDLSRRLPYEVKYVVGNNKYVHSLHFISTYGLNPIAGDNYRYDACDIECVKPYLFPLTKETFENGVVIGGKTIVPLKEISCEGYDGFSFDKYLEYNNNGEWFDPSTEEVEQCYEWLFAHHFDVNGLIEEGIAIDATGKDIY